MRPPGLLYPIPQGIYTLRKERTMVEPTSEELKRIKELETAMLCAFLKVCQKLDLRYYLVGGTLLGAVRHQGFIPWDDDIDVAMRRGDYEIFLREGQKYLPEYYFLQHLGSDSAYCMNFAKIRDCRTTLVEYSVRKYPMNHGVFIDIFPLDSYPEGKTKQRIMDFHQKIFKYRTRAAVEVPSVSRHSFPVELGLNLVAALTRIPYPNLGRAVKTRENLHKNAPSGSHWANYCGAWGKKEIMPADWYGNGAELTFEGMTVVGPAQYDKWLTQVYGDYMQLPPVDKRVGHHYAEFIDLDMPCGEYLKKYY